jgi:hypothetical protein
MLMMNKKTPATKKNVTGAFCAVAKAMEGFFQAAADNSMDIHSVMIVKDGNVIYSHRVS